jgi:hypothetical protein
MTAGTPGDPTTATLLSTAEKVRAAQLLEHINLALLGERSAVALCALTGVLCVVIAELQAKHDVPIPSLLRMLMPLLETQAGGLADKIQALHSHRPGHA